MSLPGRDHLGRVIDDLDALRLKLVAAYGELEDVVTEMSAPWRYSDPLLVSRGRSATYRVKPLADAPARRSGLDEFHPDTTSNPAPEQEPSPAEDGALPLPDTITSGQLRMLHALLNENGLGDRETGLAWISVEIGRGIETSKDLTKAEASKVIDRLNAMGSDQ